MSKGTCPPPEGAGTARRALYGQACERKLHDGSYCTRPAVVVVGGKARCATHAPVGAVEAACGCDPQGTHHCLDRP